jgi:hypothetical protein
MSSGLKNMSPAARQPNFEEICYGHALEGAKTQRQFEFQIWLRHVML